MFEREALDGLGELQMETEEQTRSKIIPDSKKLEDRRLQSCELDGASRSPQVQLDFYHISVRNVACVHMFTYSYH